MNDLFSNKILFVKKNINISELLERNFMALRKTKNSGKATPKKITKEPKHVAGGSHNFHIEFKNEYQSLAWAAFQQHDVLFLTGPAGSGKSHLATAFALEQVLNRKRKKIILTRPVVEAGESLGFLPGEFADKIQPYMMPLFDCIESMVGTEGLWKDRIDEAIEVAPIAFMRGRTFNDAICILDEAQNCSMMQLKLFLTRFGENSKVIITGDPTQSDIGGKVALVEVMQKLKDVNGVGIVEFKENAIVRHPLVGRIIEKLS